MYFKERYKKEIDQVAPSREFLSSLSKKMEQESAAKKRSRIRMASSLVSVAACAALIIGAAFFFNKNSDDSSVQPDISQSASETNKPDVKADAAASAAATEGISLKNWHEENISDAEAFEILVSKLRSDTKKLYFSDTDSFDSNSLLSEAEKEQLLTEIENARETESHGNAVTNYMAVFTDGSIAKFTICDDNTLYIKGIETSFEF